MAENPGTFQLRALPPPGWPGTQEQARAVQDELRHRVVLDEPGPPPGTGRVTGVDVAYDDARGLVAAAAVVLDAATLEVVEEATAVGPVAFPYVPGLLAFRELPAVLAVLESLTARPGLVVCDGYGLAHPRRFGLASHLGVLTGLPTMGVAKNPFTFAYEEPGTARGCSAPLVEYAEYAAGAEYAACAEKADKAVKVERGARGGRAGRADGVPGGVARAGGAGGAGEVVTGPGPGAEPDPEPEVVGRALRTRSGVKPVFVSVGHRVDLRTACAHTLRLTPRFRLPETTRRADALCRSALRTATG